MDKPYQFEEKPEHDVNRPYLFSFSSAFTNSFSQNIIYCLSRFETSNPLPINLPDIRHFVIG